MRTALTPSPSILNFAPSSFLFLSSPSTFVSLIPVVNVLVVTSGVLPVTSPSSGSSLGSFPPLYSWLGSFEYVRFAVLGLPADVMSAFSLRTAWYVITISSPVLPAALMKSLRTILILVGLSAPSLVAVGVNVLS